MTDEEKKYFRKIFVAEPTHDFTALKQYSDDIVFVTTGLEDISRLGATVGRSMADFDPTEDAIIPVGKLATVMFIGMMILTKMMEKGSETFNFGIYRDKDYTFKTVYDLIKVIPNGNN